MYIHKMATHTHSHVYVCVHACMDTRVGAHTHTHTHTRTHTPQLPFFSSLLPSLPSPVDVGVWRKTTHKKMHN